MLAKRTRRAEPSLLGNPVDRQICTLEQLSGAFDPLLGQPRHRAQPELISEPPAERPHAHVRLSSELCQNNWAVEVLERPHSGV